MKEVNENFSVRARPLSEYSFLEVEVYTNVTEKLWDIAEQYTEKIYLELGYSSKQVYESKLTEE